MLGSDVMRGYNDMLILCLLLEGDSYGYAISREIEAAQRRRVPDQGDHAVFRVRAAGKARVYRPLSGQRDAGQAAHLLHHHGRGPQSLRRQMRGVAGAQGRGRPICKGGYDRWKRFVTMWRHCSPPCRSARMSCGSRPTCWRIWRISSTPCWTRAKTRPRRPGWSSQASVPQKELRSELGLDAEPAEIPSEPASKTVDPALAEEYRQYQERKHVLIAGRGRTVHPRSPFAQNLFCSTPVRWTPLGHFLFFVHGRAGVALCIRSGRRDDYYAELFSLGKDEDDEGDGAEDANYRVATLFSSIAFQSPL